MDEKKRQQLDQAIQNKTAKEMAKFALEESRQKQVEKKKIRAQSIKKERAVSAIRAKTSVETKKQAEAREAKEALAARKA